MTRRNRVILFSALAVLFLTIAPSVVFYSQGWRFDWKEKKLIQTGSFYLKIRPKSVQVYIDDKFKKKTDFFFGSVLIENLLPKKYTIEVKKEGFWPWKKTLEIKEKEATEAKNIVLVPQNPDFALLAKNIDDFFFSPDGKKIIFKEKSISPNWLSQQNPNKEWALKLFDLEKKVKSHLIAESEISPLGADFFNLKFGSDSKKILLEMSVGENMRYFILEFSQEPDLIPLSFLDSSTEKISFDDKNSQKIFFLKNEMLFEKDLTKIKPPTFLVSDVVAYSILNGNIYYLDNSGFVFKTNLSGNSKEKINRNPISLKKETGYELIVLPSDILIKEGETFYLFDESSKIFSQILEPVKGLKLSPDKKKILYFNNYEIGVLYLEKTYNQPVKEAKEISFLTRFSEKIEDCFWWTSHYLLCGVGDKIKIVETDDRDRVNIVDLIEFENPKIFLNKNDQELYLLTKGDLFVSKNLLR